MSDLEEAAGRLRSGTRPPGAQNELDALNFLRESYVPGNSCVILPHLNRPVMDGYEFPDEKKDQFPADNIRVQVVSSSVFGTDRNQAPAFPHVSGFLENR